MVLFGLHDDNCALLLILFTQTTLSHHCPVVQQALDEVQLHHGRTHDHHQLETGQTQQSAIVGVLVVQKSPFILVCMLSDLLSALHLLLNGLQLLQRKQEVPVPCDFFFVDNFLGLFEIDHNEDAPRDMTGKLEVLVIRIEVDAEHLGEVNMTKRTEGKVSLFPQSYIYFLALLQVMLQHDFSIVHDLKDQDANAEHLGFGWVPPEDVGHFWVQDKLEGFSHDTVNLLLHALHLLCNPRTQPPLLLLYLLLVLLLLNLHLPLRLKGYI